MFKRKAKISRVPFPILKLSPPLLILEFFSLNWSIIDKGFTSPFNKVKGRSEITAPGNTLSENAKIDIWLGICIHEHERDF